MDFERELLIHGMYDRPSIRALEQNLYQMSLLALFYCRRLRSTDGRGLVGEWS